MDVEIISDEDAIEENPAPRTLFFLAMECETQTIQVRLHHVIQQCTELNALNPEFQVQLQLYYIHLTF